MPQPLFLDLGLASASDNAAMTNLRHCLVLSAWLIGAGNACAQAADSPLPATVTAALRQAGIPLDAISVLISKADGSQAPRIAHLAARTMQPASLIKLVTSYAALDLLGPQFTWATPVWLDGTVHKGVLQGNLVIQGQGDPSLVLERLWLLLHKVQGMGVRSIAGDIVVDRRAFALAPTDPAQFDGEPLRPYNAAPDALLINFRAIALTFTPDLAAGVARVQMDPPLWGVRVPATVPLSGPPSGCVDYRAALKADFSDPLQIRLAGSLGAGCGEKVWPLAYVAPDAYNARALEGLWRSMGGQLQGRVREGSAPNTAPSFTQQSPTLGAVIRDINKFSNNVMAQQLFLTLGRLPLDAGDQPIKPVRQRGAQEAKTATLAPATLERSREQIRRWWLQRMGTPDVPVVDKGSGLSREARMSVQALGTLLQQAFASPYMPELMASLPITGLDGTMQRSQATPANAHLKTGSLRGVIARAGYVHTDRGETLCLVAIVNHERAQAARPALDALLDWAAHSQ